MVVTTFLDTFARDRMPVLQVHSITEDGFSAALEAAVGSTLV